MKSLFRTTAARKSIKSHIAEKWKATRPYDRLDDYDLYYIDLAESLYKLLQPSRSLAMIAPHAKDTEIADLATWLIAWFEDFINELGLWKVFVDRHRELTGRDLPFYDLEGYDPEYINWQDVNLLIWAWARQVNPGKFTDPTVPFLQLEGRIITEMLESCIDEAPARAFWDDFSDSVKTMVSWMCGCA